MANENEESKSSVLTVFLGYVSKDKYLPIFSLVALLFLGYFWFTHGITSYFWVMLILWLVFIVFYYLKKAMFALYVYLIAFVVLVLISIWFLNGNVPAPKITSTNTSSNSTDTSDTTKATSEDILPTTTFTSGLGSWFEHVWYKAASSGGEVTTGSDGVTFKAVQNDSRSGVMLDIGRDVSNFKKVIITAKVVAKLQTLTGTGLNGREAPVAVAVSYVDVNGVDHNLLGEDPSAAGQMFWRGFYYLDAKPGYGNVNGVKVTQNKPYTFTYDLMTLSPKPKTINFVGIEGAGWKSREGSVSSISITGE